MSPATIAALRTFAAAARHSPEPSQAVADLALLIAELEEGNQAPAPAPAPAAPVDNSAGGDSDTANTTA